MKSRATILSPGFSLATQLVFARGVAALLSLVVVSPLAGQPTSTPNASSSPALSTNAAVKEITPDILQIGAVRLDKARRAVSFPATLNMKEGLIEYLLVTTSGKTHESLLRTEAEPAHLQVAMLLLGAKGSQAGPLTHAPSGGPITATELAQADLEAVKGEPVSIELRWKSGAKEATCRVEELVFNRREKKQMTKGDFTFNGSLVWNGKFVAQQEGSIVSTIIDPVAMFNNPRPGREDDQIWEIIKRKAPPVGTPVEVRITLKPEPPGSK